MMMMGTVPAQRACGSSRGLCLARDGFPLPSPLCTAPGTAEASGTDLAFPPEKYL